MKLPYGLSGTRERLLFIGSDMRRLSGVLGFAVVAFVFACLSTQELGLGYTVHTAVSERRRKSLRSSKHPRPSILQDGEEHAPNNPKTLKLL